MAGVGAQRAVEISKWWERVKSWRASHFSLEQRALLKNSKILLSALKFVFYPRSERFRRLQKMIVLLRYLPWSHETDDIRDIEEAFVSFTGTHFPSELKLSSHGVLGVHPMASRLSQSKCHPFSHAVSGSDSTWKLSSYSLQIWPGLPWHPGANLSASLLRTQLVLSVVVPAHLLRLIWQLMSCPSSWMEVLPPAAPAFRLAGREVITRFPRTLPSRILPESLDPELVLSLLYYSVLWYLRLLSSLIFHLNERLLSHWFFLVKLCPNKHRRNNKSCQLASSVEKGTHRGCEAEKNVLAVAVLAETQGQALSSWCMLLLLGKNQDFCGNHSQCSISYVSYFENKIVSTLFFWNLQTTANPWTGRPLRNVGQAVPR